ncbi:hypothetical protein DEB41_09055 [Vibrio anguillarum]|uniref:Uncharacterized protein n=2 Tax=Vibrio anguillarum TaxID=55601 RepID=A0AAW4AQS8_VIBAN|nr:hypothetical protein VAA_02277 [Vibrio anguillarum 775]AGU57974.1 heat shock protein HtpX [Vibrio anguillarum M3]ASF91532.1 hypothetical protein CEA93_05640 [Vibrio anguillarum]NAW90959.1 hypothetical protein [Vibrio sp. V24_P1S3T111]NAX18892.1 hypothetical protein [Vibrio sp. V22_P2S10T140]NAX42118.1 hypothetical protein [Vibrio sp. V25_P4S6T154]NNN68879.1 hypothetical protein [Vibrio sp. 3-2(1)]NNN98762.1 hypothetical protein [Vibrio sp. B1-2]OXX25936.1 hypothetical protein B9J88_02920
MGNRHFRRTKDSIMAETSNYQMAIDLLCCHLGLSEDEAKQQLGIGSTPSAQQQISDTQQALMGLMQEK